MAKKTAKSERKNPTAKGKTPGGVEAIRHQTDKRANIPTRQTSRFVGEVRERVARYERNLALDPQLVWRGKDDAKTQAILRKGGSFATDSGESSPYNELKDAPYSTESKPFPAPKPRKIVVKVINHFGDEVLCVREL